MCCGIDSKTAGVWSLNALLYLLHCAVKPSLICDCGQLIYFKDDSTIIIYIYMIWTASVSSSLCVCIGDGFSHITDDAKIKSFKLPIVINGAEKTLLTLWFVLGFFLICLFSSDRNKRSMASMLLVPRLLRALSPLDLIVWTEKCWRRLGSGSRWQQSSWLILYRECTEQWLLCAVFFIVMSIPSLGSLSALSNGFTEHLLYQSFWYK